MSAGVIRRGDAAYMIDALAQALLSAEDITVSVEDNGNVRINGRLAATIRKA